MWKFQFYDEPEILYVLDTGLEDEYLIFFGDFTGIDISNAVVRSKEHIETTFNIKLV